MNKKQLSEHIGNIDDNLIQQAEKIPNYSKQLQKKRIQRFMATAAVFVLMFCSFSVGALAFTHEVIVEVPVEQEKVTLDEIGITLILPDSWKGKYEVIENTSAPTNSSMWEFCVKSIYDTQTPIGESGVRTYRGTLFYVFQYADHSMSASEFAYNEEIAGTARYLFSTENATYAIKYATDLQVNPENVTQAEEYRAMMQSISELQFVMPGVAEVVANHSAEITQEIYSLISETEQIRYKISNCELKLDSVEGNRGNYIFVADWEWIRTVEDDPFIQGLRQAAETLSDEQEKVYAEEIIDDWIVEMQSWRDEDTEIETPIVAVLEGENKWTLYYPFVEDGKETLILLDEYVKANWTENSEVRQQQGIDTMNEAISMFRGQ